MVYYTDYLRFWRIDIAAPLIPPMLPAHFSSLVVAMGKSILLTLSTRDFQALLAILSGGFILTASGIVLRRAKSWHAAGFGVLYALELVAWNFPPNERFVIPLVVIGVVSAVAFLCPVSRRWPRWGIAAVAVLGSLLGLRNVGGILEVASADARDQHTAALWLAERPSRPVLAFRDTWFYLCCGTTGLKPVVATRNDPAGGWHSLDWSMQHISEFARVHGSRYLVDTPWDWNTFPTLSNRDYREKLFARNLGMRKVFDDGRVRIYEISP